MMSQTPHDVAWKLHEHHAAKVAKKTGRQPIQVPSRKRAVESSIEDSEYQPDDRNAAGGRCTRAMENTQTHTLHSRMRAGLSTPSRR